MTVDNITRKSADVAGPSSIFARTTVTSSERVAIPAAFVGNFITFQAQTSDVFIAFGTSGVTASASAVSADTNTAAVNGTLYIPAGQERTYRINQAVTHFAHISANTSGILRWANTTGPGEP